MINHFQSINQNTKKEMMLAYNNFKLITEYYVTMIHKHLWNFNFGIGTVMGNMNFWGLLKPHFNKSTIKNKEISTSKIKKERTKVFYR